MKYTQHNEPPQIVKCHGDPFAIFEWAYTRLGHSPMTRDPGFEKIMAARK